MFASIFAVAQPASAFTTRVHIALSNEVRASLIESGDGTIRLRWSEHTVRIPMEDADAIINQPLAFRAGAIGPDNVVFPAMTDGSHGVEQDPYRQCELLYAEALTEAERAYALGCFLHGASDAIAHHFVNYFTGETFTLNPISAARLPSYDNVIGHIVAESVIQGALHTADPTMFDDGSLQHAIPHSFVLRTYFDADSPVWQRLSLHAMERWEAARATDPEGTVLDWARVAGFSAWEQVAMSPVYIGELQLLRTDLRAWIESEIADMADPTSTRGAELGVTAGSDGIVGTPDDDTACTASCPTLAGRYYVYVNILAPRYSAGGIELPSAFDVLSDRIGDQLYGFLPALVQVIENISTVLNAPIAAGDTTDHGLDLDGAEISGLFMPLTDWVDTLVATTDSGFGDLASTLTPEWYADLENFLRTLGVDISIASILRILFGPILEQIRDALVLEVRNRAETYISELTAGYRAGAADWRAAIEAGLASSAPAGLGGHALDHALDSGLYAYSFNLTAATFANHDVLLVASDPIGSGPTSFDASYTPEWSQIGQCTYLREAVFPRGTGVAALLSVEQGGTFHAASVSGDSPVECHDGSLSSFGTPSTTSCAHTDLDSLLLEQTGSLSRAYPPGFAAGEPGCRRLIVPGLPDPPPMPDAGPTQLDGGTVDRDGGGGGPTDAGCSCSAPRGGTRTPWPLLGLALLAAVMWRRRGMRRRWASIVLLAMPLALVACDGEMPSGEDAGSQRDATTPDPDGGGAEDAGGDGDAGTMIDGGPDLRRRLLDALSGTVWSGLAERDEGGRLVTRAYEMRFDTTDLRWAEIRNPFGPSRQRILRTFNPQRDGRTVESTVMIPAGWETPPELNGDRDTWEFEIVEGTPRFLRITNTTSGLSEELAEGAWPAPADGLTAEVRVFGSSGSVYDSYCGSSSWTAGPILEFARGTSASPALGEDVVAGAHIGEWADGIGAFSVIDIDGFDQLGGTELSDSANFTARFTGTVSHTGHFSVRERDDGYDQMAAWIFTGASAGTGGIGSQLWEIFHYFGNDDEVSTQPGLLGAGDLEVEIIVVWCNMAGQEPFALEASLVSASGPWQIFGDVPSTPVLDESLFPPAL